MRKQDRQPSDAKGYARSTKGIEGAIVSVDVKKYSVRNNDNP